LKGIILMKGPHSAGAKRVLGSHLRGILIPQIVEKLEPDFKEIADSEDHFWPEAFESINNVFEFSSAEMPIEAIERLNVWLTWITPQDVKQRLELFVTKAPYEHREGAGGKFTDISEKRAEGLAEELFRSQTDLRPFLDELQRGEQRQAWVFGRKWGELA